MKLVRGKTWPWNKAAILPACFGVTVVWEVGDAEYKTRVLTANLLVPGKVTGAECERDDECETNAVCDNSKRCSEYVGRIYRTVRLQSYCGVHVSLVWHCDAVGTFTMTAWLWGGKKQVQNRIFCTNKQN